MRFDGFVLAVDSHPEPSRSRVRRWAKRRRGDLDYGVRSGLAFAVLTAPRVNAPAWFALAVAAPLALLALAAAMTNTGLPRMAGVAAAVLLLAAILLAIRSVEVRRFRPTLASDPELTRAFCLTVGQAVGLLFVVILGARLSGEAVAVGLAMAAGPLAMAVATHAWRRTFRPVDVSEQAPVVAGRDWLGEWAQAERRNAPAEPEIEAECEPVAAPVVLFPTPPRVVPTEVEWEPPVRRRAGARR